MAIAVKFDTYGHSDVLELREVQDAPPGPGEVLVGVVATGLNPGEISIREGYLDAMFPTTFPSGEGTDFAGTVTMVGPGVTGIVPGDDVIGMSDDRSAHAQNVTIAADHVVLKPAALPWEQAGALAVAATTAQASVDAVNVRAGDVVVVAGAAGGVGILAAQLAKLRHATVYGTASAANADELSRLGIRPIEYGEGILERLPDHIDAFLDCHGHGNVALAIAKGVDPERINTIIDFDAVSTYAVKSEGQATVIEPLAAVARIGQLIADGEIELPIRRKYSFDQVREAYDELGRGHGLGKVVLWLGISD